MRRALFSLAVVLSSAAAASGEIIAEWRSDVSGEYNIYTLSVTPTEGEMVGGVDIKVVGSDFEYTPGYIFSETRDLKTHFLMDQSYMLPNWDVQQNINSQISIVGENRLMGALAVVFGGVYYPGWNSTFDLLQVVVLSDSEVAPDDFALSRTSSQHSGPPVITINDVDGTKLPIRLVPEPGTMMLLAAGLIGLVVYVWRKRNR